MLLIPATCRARSDYLSVIKGDGAGPIYRLKDASGGTATDSSHLALNGIYVGSPTYSVTHTGSSRKGMGFGSSGSSYFNTPDLSSLFPSSDTYSLELWAWIATGNYGLVINEFGQATVDFDWQDVQMEINSDGSSYVATWAGHLAGAINYNVINYNAWNHMALVYDDSAHTIVGYVNGVAGVPLTGVNRAAPQNNGHAQYWNIGSLNSGAGFGSSPCPATVSDFAVYPQIALTSAQVAKHYAAGK